MSIMFSGVGVSRGIAIGTVHRLQRHDIEVGEISLNSQDIPAEIERFNTAVDTARTQLHNIVDNIPLTLNVEIGAFIEAHLMMLDDDILAEGTARIIKERQCNAEWALKLQMERIGQVFDAMEDEYLATRKNDISHVIQRIMRALQNIGPPEHDHDPQVWEGKIVVADDLTPADTIVMQHHGVAGFATESGGPLSHTAILARSLDIPAVVGLHEARRYIRDGEPIVVDGNIGLVLVDPHYEAVEYFNSKRNRYLRKRRELVKIKDAPAQTLCGTRISLQANIETEADVAALRKVNAEGVGLYRTEYLYMRHTDVYPSEQEHYDSYIKLVRALKGAPLTIRTVDIGGDKEIQHTQAGTVAHNPALGVRGVRLCINEPAIFLPQLRAILRASAKGPIQILLPMLTNVEEVMQIKRLLENTKSDLRNDGHKFDENIQMGGMIEVPATAIAAQQFVRHLDFLSIGTNDLIQYTLAIDRVDDQVNYLYDPLHPAVLMLIGNIIKAGDKQNIPVSMCGEMAGDSRYTRLLLALGLRSFSMPANALLEVKSVINNSSLGKLDTHARKISKCDNPLKQIALLDKLNTGIESIAH
ncbi:MAG: phosphoenolpyruvate--protein phosphotransferase [Pseudomonadota bacterium]